MKSLSTVLLGLVLFLTSGCYSSGITGKVLDNATEKPIEGAVVVAQWTKQRGIPGMQYSNLHKVTETLTDKEGKFSLRGSIGVLIDPPQMIIYKEGYVPWRNDMIFPGGTDKLTKDHEWKDNALYKLDIFSDTYTMQQLSDFSNYGFMIEGLYRVPTYDKIFSKLQHAAHDEAQKELNSNKR